MGLAKYRADTRGPVHFNGSAPFYSTWIGGPTLAKVENCPFDNGPPGVRVTAHVTGPADTYFSIPAVCSYEGKRITGYITGSDDGTSLVFHCMHSQRSKFEGVA